MLWCVCPANRVSSTHMTGRVPEPIWGAGREIWGPDTRTIGRSSPGAAVGSPRPSVRGEGATNDTGLRFVGVVQQGIPVLVLTGKISSAVNEDLERIDTGVRAEQALPNRPG